MFESACLNLFATELIYFYFLFDNSDRIKLVLSPAMYTAKDILF